MKIYRFRDCYLNPTERRVLKGGKFLELTPKAFDILLLLIENGNRIVTKDEILGKVWNGSFVEEGNLAVHISKLRRTLDETKNQPFIETVQGSGYRFVSDVKTVNGDEWQKRLTGEDHSFHPKSAPEWSLNSIAVLPLENESGDTEIEYLADGLTESFINSLSRLTNLKVIARNTVFRYKNKTAEARQIGETLDVATVLTGRIRVAKDNLLISIELIKVADDTQLWGTQFNQPFAKIFEIQENIILEIVEKLRVEINNASQKYNLNSITKNSESYKLYLKGKYFSDRWTLEDITKAIQCFERSVSYDPTNTHSYAEIVECYLALYLSDNLSYKNTLTKISPLLSVIDEFNQSSDSVQSILGAKKMFLDRRFEEAEKHLQSALYLNFNCSVARNRYLQLLIYLERFSEALKELNHLMIVDSLSVIFYQRVGRMFYYMNQFEKALVYLEEFFEIEPINYINLTLLGAALTELGEYERALKLFQNALDIQFNFEIISMIGYTQALAGNKNKAREIIRQIKSQSTANNQPSSKLARIYLALGEKETAYKFLEQSLEDDEADLIALKIDPRLRKIRNESRYKELISKVGLPNA